MGWGIKDDNNEWRNALLASDQITIALKTK
jgi:hypothetical protein